MLHTMYDVSRVVCGILNLRISDLSDWISSQDMDASPVCDVYGICCSGSFGLRFRMPRLPLPRFYHRHLNVNCQTSVLWRTWSRSSCRVGV
jgi:hypothetical protein